MIYPELLPAEFHEDELHDEREPHQPASSNAPQLQDRLDTTERTLVRDALDQANGHKGRAAEILGISRHALKRRLQRLGLQ